MSYGNKGLPCENGDMFNLQLLNRNRGLWNPLFSDTKAIQLS